MGRGERTVDVDDAGAVADEAVGGGEQVVEADAPADFLDDLDVDNQRCRC